MLQRVSRMGLGDVPFTILFARRIMVWRHVNDGDVMNSLKRCLIFGFSGMIVVISGGRVPSLLLYLILSYLIYTRHNLYFTSIFLLVLFYYLY